MTTRAKILSPDRIKGARHTSDLFPLWPLCLEPKCRKAGACRAPYPTCFEKCLDLVPEGAGAFVVVLQQGKEENLDCDEALARVPGELREAWENWHAAVSRITGRPSFAPWKET